MTVAVLGAGAFGQALAVALSAEHPVVLWGRSGVAHGFPNNVTVLSDIGDLSADIVLLAIPMQALGGFLDLHAPHLTGRVLVAACKGIDCNSLLGPSGVIALAVPGASIAVLTGPGFASEIIVGMPTALTLATADDALGVALQQRLSTRTLRIYRTTDVAGAELGGAIKNVIAIAAGVATGAGIGLSARAAVITRGQAEMTRLAIGMGARAETLAGLSGLGDLILTCTSPQSRNFRYGEALGRGDPFDPNTTVEGVPTARAVLELAQSKGIDMPLSATVAALIDGRITISEAVQSLLNRPLKPE